MQDACIGELSSAVGVTAAAVMAGRGDEALLRADVPAIHVLDAESKDVDARHKAGHDGAGQRASMTARYFALVFPPIVMAGRGDEALLRADVPAIHVLDAGSKDVDARH